MMRRRLTSLMVSLTVLTVLTGCTGSKAVKPDTPTNAAIVLTNAMRVKDYSLFQSYFTEARKDAVTEADFERFSEAYPGGAAFSNFEVISFPTGEMFLVRLAPPIADKDGLYKAEDMIPVPEEMKAFFQDN